MAQIVGGGSFQSASDCRARSGLGRSEKVESIEIVWPSGGTSRFRELATDAGYTVREAADRIGRRSREHAGGRRRLSFTFAQIDRKLVVSWPCGAACAPHIAPAPLGGVDTSS